MKNTIRQVFHSPKFVIGFGIFMVILLTMLIYPLFNPGSPLEMIGLGTFAKPGTYVSLYDSVGTDTRTFTLPDADANRIASMVGPADRLSMMEWFSAMEIATEGLDINDTDALLALWRSNYDPTARPAGMTKAQRNYYVRLNNTITDANTAETLIVSSKTPEGESEEKASIGKNDYVNVGDVANVKTLPLGTDNFGRDVFKELVSATYTFT